MRVLVVGASGFIGRRIVGHLCASGHEVVAAVRRVEETRRIFPGIKVVRCDLRFDVAPDAWTNHLRGIEAVVNAAGVLQDGAAQQIHADGPKALYAACADAGIRRVVHISAVSADSAAGTAYAETKLAGERALRALDLDWVILRPSLIYGEGSYGGTSMLRGLAGFPYITPLPGTGDQVFQPLHVDDLCRAVALALSEPHLARTTISPVGPERLTLREIVRLWRGWLGIAPAPVLALPMGLAGAAAKLGDWLNLAPLTTTSLQQLVYGNVAPLEPFVSAVAFTPRRFEDALLERPANVQDRWHARLFWPRLLLRFGLAAFWLLSGIVGLIADGALTNDFAAAVGWPQSFVAGLAFIGCVADIAIGLALLAGRRPRWTAIAQLVLIVGYPLLLALALPRLLLDPLGALMKNLPLLLTVLMSMAIAEDW